MYLCVIYLGPGLEHVVMVLKRAVLVFVSRVWSCSCTYHSPSIG